MDALVENTQLMYQQKYAKTHLKKLNFNIKIKFRLLNRFILFDSLFLSKERQNSSNVPRFHSWKIIPDDI